MPPVNDISTVVSLLPVRIDENKPGLIPGQYQMPAVDDPMKDIHLLLVMRASFPVYLDESRPALVVPSPSDTVAESICRDFKVASSFYQAGVAEPGLFWVREAADEKLIRTKYAQELEEARAKQIMWFKRCVEGADDDWGKYHMRKMISTLQRLACKCLKLEREWYIEGEVAQNLALVKCIFCRAEIDPEAVTCRFCTGIQDPARHAALSGGKTVQTVNTLQGS
jgi:hypothetical protein